MTYTSEQQASTAAPTGRGLQLEDVCLTLGDGDSTVTALDHVNLTVEPGELLAVIGPSGAGKSSLLAVAGVLSRPTSGTVLVDGTDVSALGSARQAELRRDRIGFVFQSGNLLPALTAVDQLRFALHVSGVRKSAGRDPRALLDQVGMGHKADRRPHELSGGERQRVGIARALVTAPAVLLVTSRPPPWTASAATRSSSCSPTRPTSSASRPSWSPTTTTSWSTATARSGWRMED